jgi:hypothetical protein
VTSDFDVGAPALQANVFDDVLAPEPEDALLPDLDDGP